MLHKIVTCLIDGLGIKLMNKERNESSIELEEEYSRNYNKLS